MPDQLGHASIEQTNSHYGGALPPIDVLIVLREGSARHFECPHCGAIDDVRQVVWTSSGAVRNKLDNVHIQRTPGALYVDWRIGDYFAGHGEVLRYECSACNIQVALPAKVKGQTWS